MPAVEKTAGQYQSEIREHKATINDLEAKIRHQDTQVAAAQKSQSRHAETEAKLKQAEKDHRATQAAYEDLSKRAAEIDAEREKDAALLEAARDLKDALARLQ